MEKEKMKTTLYLDRDLYYEGKRVAIDRRQTTTELINDAITYYLQQLKKGRIKKEEASKTSRRDLIERIRARGYRSGMKDSVKFQKWVRS